jgi:ribosomal 50S subunit-recycling heat shock protein
MDKKYLMVIEDQKIRLDKFLVSELDDYTRTQIQDLISGNNVLVNGLAVKPSCILKPSDVIEVTFPDPVASEILPEDIPLDIYYEDEDLIVVNKPSGVLFRSDELWSMLCCFTAKTCQGSAESCEPGLFIASIKTLPDSSSLARMISVTATLACNS